MEARAEERHDASGVSGGRGEWRNELPVWIREHADYQRLKQSMKMTLQAIADKADAPDLRTGDLNNCWGGSELVRKAGGSRATFWRHVDVLEKLGFVVCRQRGFRVAGKDLGNVWSIPGSSGGLDHLKVSRRMQRQVHVGGGVYKPQFFPPGGETPELFAGSAEAEDKPGRAPVGPQIMQQALVPLAPKPSNAVDDHIGDVTDMVSEPVGSTGSDLPGAPQNETTPSLNLRLPPVSKRDYPPSQNETPPFPSPSPYPSPSHPRGGFAAQGEGGAEAVRLRDLVRWLNRAGWRSNTKPSRRRKLIERDPEHALRCWAQYQDKAAEIAAGGGEVRDPAGLFDALFEGRSLSTPRKGAAVDVRAQLRWLAEQAKREDQR